MVIFYNLFILIFSFYILAIICERYFVSSLDIIAQRLNMNSDMSGATLMAIGSSAPELFISLFALFRPGNESIGVGTIVGSALFNVLVIIGVSSIVRKNVVAWQPVLRDIVFYILSILLLLFTFRDGVISFTEVSIFIILYSIYVLVVIYLRRLIPYYEETKDLIPSLEKDLEKEEKKDSFLSKQLLLIDKILGKLFPDKKYYIQTFLISIFMIMGLSWVLVQSAISISVSLHIPAVIIGLTVLAIGTSIPDYISSVIVAKQGRGGMAISNAIGSNIFNILAGLGIPWFFVLLFSHNSINVVTTNLSSSILLLLATTVLVLFIFIIKKWKVNKKYGFLLVGVYMLYIIWEVLQAISI